MMPLYNVAKKRTQADANFEHKNEAKLEHVL